MAKAKKVQKIKSADDKRIENNAKRFVAKLKDQKTGAYRRPAEADPMRLQYRLLTDEEKTQMGSFKSAFEKLWKKVDKLGDARDLSIAKTHLEDACMRVVRHLTGPKT